MYTELTGKRLEQLLIPMDTPLKRALETLNTTGHQILLCVDEDKRVLGLLSDGDIRRHLIGGGDIDRPVCEAMNRDFGREAEGADDPSRKLAYATYNHLPVLDENGRAVRLVMRINYAKGKAAKVPVVVMAGGKGTRLSPLTRIIPKPLMPVGDRTMLEVVLESFARQGFDDFRIIVNYKRELIRSYMAETFFPHRLEFVEEDQYLGTAGGLRLVKDLHSTFILTNCDITTDVDLSALLRAHRDNKADLTILGAKKAVEIPYGVLDLEDGGEVKTVREKPSYDVTVIMGIYVLEPSILEILPKGRFYGMDSLIRDAMRAGKHVYGHVTDSEWFDIGQFEEYKTMLDKLGLLGA